MHQLLNVDPKQEHQVIRDGISFAFSCGVFSIASSLNTSSPPLAKLCFSGTFSQSTILNFLLPIGSLCLHGERTETDIRGYQCLHCYCCTPEMNQMLFSTEELPTANPKEETH